LIQGSKVSIVGRTGSKKLKTSEKQERHQNEPIRHFFTYKKSKWLHLIGSNTSFHVSKFFDDGIESNEQRTIGQRGRAFHSREGVERVLLSSIGLVVETSSFERLLGIIVAYLHADSRR
jgi:hypothetical protein